MDVWSQFLLRSETGLIFALILTFALYFLFRKTSELSRHAAQNTAATLVICGANYAVALMFLDELNVGAQRAYDILAIPKLPADVWEGVPLWLVCLIGIAARDFADYWSHRLMHTRWGWPTHAAHHSDTHVNAFTGYRVHALEVVVMALSYILMLTWLQMPEAIPFVMVFSSLHNKYVHMDLLFDHGPLKYLIASPVFHRWHHADTPEAYGKNLANVVPAYDLLFGTYYNPGPCTAPMGAMSSGIEDKNPLLIYLYPFQEWGRMFRKLRLHRKEPVTPADLSGTPAE